MNDLDSPPVLGQSFPFLQGAFPTFHCLLPPLLPLLQCFMTDFWLLAYSAVRCYLVLEAHVYLPHRRPGKLLKGENHFWQVRLQGCSRRLLNEHKRRRVGWLRSSARIAVVSWAGCPTWGGGSGASPVLPEDSNSWILISCRTTRPALFPRVSPSLPSSSPSPPAPSETSPSHSLQLFHQPCGHFPN